MSEMEEVGCRLKELSEKRGAALLLDPPRPQNYLLDDTKKKLIQDWSNDLQVRLNKIESTTETDLSTLNPPDLDTYLERLRKEVSSVEIDEEKISSEIDALARTVAEETALLDEGLDSLSSSLNFIHSQASHHIQTGVQDGRSISAQGGPMQVSEDYKFEIWELDQQIETSKSDLNELKELDCAFRRVEMIGQLEDIFSEVRVIEFGSSFIRLSLKTPISVPDSLRVRHKLDFLIESVVLDHELLVEVDENNMEVKNIEILPGDVPIKEISEAIKSSRHTSSSVNKSILGCLVRQVQHHIFLCGLRRLFVNDANKSRHSFEYSDRDGTVTAHLVGGIDAFIKVPQGWPISSSALNLVSIKNTDIHSKGISLGLLYRVKEVVNLLDVQKRYHLASFLDAIEEVLIQEMHSEFQRDTTTTTT